MKLWYGNQHLTELPPIPEGTVELNCFGNNLTALPPLPSSLEILTCYDNQLTVLPTTLPSRLKTLRCGNNQLTVLPPLPSSLEELTCSYNNLDVLPPLPSGLNILWYFPNQATPAVPDLPIEMKKLIEYYEPITLLKLSASVYGHVPAHLDEYGYHTPVACTSCGRETVCFKQVTFDKKFNVPTRQDLCHKCHLKQ